MTWDQMGGIPINNLPPYREMEERAARALYPEWAKTQGKEPVETVERSWEDAYLKERDEAGSR